MRPTTLRGAGWLITMAAALATDTLAAGRAVSEGTPIRINQGKPADIRLMPPVREPPRLRPEAPVDIFVAPASPLPLHLQPTDDPQISEEISRLQATGSSLSAPDPKNRATSRSSATEAAWTLGLIYLHGAGVAQDPVLARRWFELASTAGHPLAAAGLAWCEIESCGRPSNLSAARTWLALLGKTRPDKAAYLEWLMVVKNSPLETATPATPGASAEFSQAHRDLLVRAARAGDAQARNEMGLEQAHLERWSEALVYFRSAAAQSPAARINAKLAEQHLDQERTGARQASGATELLADAKRQHRGDGVPANYNEAIRLYREAEKRGSVEAGRMLALILSQPIPSGGINIEWMRQLAWFDMSSSVPRTGSPATGSDLQRDASPLFEWMPTVWQERMFNNRSR